MPGAKVSTNICELSATMVEASVEGAQEHGIYHR